VTASLQDAFRHHSWANSQLLDVCRDLTEEQLVAPAHGLYGGVLETMRHIVGADAWYLFVLTAGRVPNIDEDTLDLAELRGCAERHASAWEEVVREERDPDEDIVVHRDDGTVSHARAGIRLAQALHHGSDHRSQICTQLTALGIEPPEIDVWAYGDVVGRVSEDPPEG
jgi:uncharacterized damage-inducible protein DinB